MRARILDAAAELFQAKGYNDTSMQDITATAGVTSGALHYHYGSKKSLGLAVVEHRIAPALRAAWIEPMLAAPSVEEGVKRSMSAIAGELKQQGFVRGCPVNNLTIELGFADPEFRAALEPIFTEWRRTMARKIEAEAKLPPTRADAAATFIIAAYSGAMALAKAHQSSVPLETTARLLGEWLQEALHEAKRARHRQMRLM